MKTLANGLTKVIRGSLAIVAAILLPGTAHALGVGNQAPDFKLVGSDGKYYTLSQFRGKQPVVIAFFPKAHTGG